MGAPAKETACFVWNGKSGSVTSAGGATRTALDANDASDFMDADGDPLAVFEAAGYDGIAIIEISGGTYDGKVGLYDATTTWTTGIIDGTIAKINFSLSGTQTYESGYYEVAVVDGNTLALVDLTHEAHAQEACDCYVGGAFATISAASSSDITNAADYTRTCYVRGDVTQTKGVAISSGGGVGYTHKNFIACDSSWDALDWGSYVTYDASAVAGGLATHSFNIKVKNVVMWGFKAVRPGGDAAPGPSQCCFLTASSVAHGGLWMNCYAEGGYFNFYLGSYISTVGCVGVNPLLNTFRLVAHGTSARYCYAQSGAQTGTNAAYYLSNAGNSVDHCIAKDSYVGFHAADNYAYAISNCIAYECDLAVNASSANAATAVIDCLFYAKADCYDVEIANDSSIVCEGCVTNYSGAYDRISGLGQTNVTGLDFSADDPLTDPDNEDFTIDLDSTNAQTYILNKGVRAGYVSNGTGVLGTSHVGACLAFDLPPKSSVLSSDTIMGLTGTASAGGGGLLMANKRGNKQ